MAYHTKQKDWILEFFRKHPTQQYTAKETAAEIKKTNTIGESTVYRLLAQLTRDGLLRRFTEADTSYYAYTADHTDCHEHFHTLCTECGSFVHVNCSELAELSKHMGMHHRFFINLEKTVLYGVCESCAAKKGECAHDS